MVSYKKEADFGRGLAHVHQEDLQLEVDVVKQTCTHNYLSRMDLFASIYLYNIIIMLCNTIKLILILL